MAEIANSVGRQSVTVVLDVREAAHLLQCLLNMRCAPTPQTAPYDGA